MPKPNVCFVHFVRKNSTRFPHKVYAALNGETLINIAVDKCKKYNQYIIMSDADRVDYKWTPKATTLVGECKGRIWPELIQEFIHFFKGFDWIIDANFVCHPFLMPTTIDTIVDMCSKLTFPFTIATEHRGIIWNEYRSIILGEGELADTKNNPTYFVPAHVAYCYRFKDLTKDEATLSQQIIPVPFSLTPWELIDIDTPLDYMFAQDLTSSPERNPVILFSEKQ